MKRLIVAAALAAVLPVSSYADQHPNTARGFNANGVYQFNGIDTVSAFNGNLSLTIPIGPAYPIGGGLTYQLRLVSNGNLWGPEEQDVGDLNGDCSKPDESFEQCMHAYPDRRANAGMGWSLSLGRLFPPDEETNDSGKWIYESVDGSEHHFYPQLNPGDSTNPDIAYTQDGTYLRLVRIDSTTRTIEFPNGEVHTFRSDEDLLSSADDANRDLYPWKITKIGNQYAPNALTISYVDATDGDLIPHIDLSDGHRSHRIEFQSYSFEGGVSSGWNPLPPNPATVNSRMLVKKVILAAFQDPACKNRNPPCAPAVATYVFDYQSNDQGRPDWHNIPTNYVTAAAPTQTLTSLTLPDETTFSFDYRNSTDDASGLPISMTVPMGGSIQWEWGYKQFPDATGPIAVFRRPMGVAVRRLYDRGATLLGTWTYEFVLDGNYFDLPPPRELKVTIVDPLGHRTENYFDVSSGDMGSFLYGLPFTPKTTDSTGTRFLSQRTLTGTQTPLRSTYVAYERDTMLGPVIGPGNNRPRSSRLVYNDDGNVFLDSVSSNYDGLGHYRTVTTSGTGVPTRVTQTNYNPTSGTAPGSITKPVKWRLDTFDSKSVSEPGRVFKSEFCFDVNGFLVGQRSIKDPIGGVRGQHDVVARFLADTRGNVSRESYYGGDVQEVPTSAGCTPPSGAPSFRTDHEWAYGALKKSTPMAADGIHTLNFLSVDNDIDANTGLVAVSRDTAEVPTSYLYDGNGRLSRVKPHGRAWTEYVYPEFSSGQTEIQANVRSSDGLDTVLTYSKYDIDGLGRVTKETVAMPGNSESVRQTQYNALGWTTQSSELGPLATPHWNYLTHDDFGRVKTATAPDGAVTTFAYTGVRTTARTSNVALPPSGTETPVTTTEQRDLYGRLVKVTEPSGPTTAASPNGGLVVADYGYDPADHLTTVKMTSADGQVVQNRIFDYDGRGMLRWESHPESGMTAYSYDALGHVLTKTQAAAQSKFDLQYVYDDAGRPSQVYGRNPFFDPGHPSDPDQPLWRLMKAFFYSEANVGANLSKGKLTTASRYNYPPLDPSGDRYLVSETYSYVDDAGRKTTRFTNILVGNETDETYWDLKKQVSTSLSYTDLDAPHVVSYPMCVGCGAPQSPARNETTTYDRGRAVSVSNFIASTTYSPNGMWNVIERSNEMTDTQVPDANGMNRPASITSSPSDSCDPPVLTGPFGSRISSPGVPPPLQVVATGSAPFTYQWFDELDNEIPGATSASYTPPSISTTTRYSVVVTNACKSVSSRLATVTVGPCTPPSVSPVSGQNANGTYTIIGGITGPEPFTITWTRVADNVVVSHDARFTVSSLPNPPTYTLSVSNGCAGGPTTATVTVTPPATMPTTGLVAVKAGSMIQVTWPAVAGAVSYEVERRGSTYSGWLVNTETHNWQNDTAVDPGRTYAYRVRAVFSDNKKTGYSNTDVATLGTFTRVTAHTPVTAASLNSMLAAVNEARALAEYAPVTWGDILSPSDPVPSPAVKMLSRHIIACRARMNEALQAIGIPAAGYPDPDLAGVPVKAIHINTVLDHLD